MISRSSLLHVASTVLTVLVCVLLAAFIAWFTVPRFLGWKPMVVLTGSMEPTLPLGSVAFVEPKAADKIKIGDVMTFNHPDPEKAGTIVTHRVTDVTEIAPGVRGFVTRGDANNADDDWVVRPEDVVGTVKFTVPYVGYISDRIDSPLGFSLLIGLPALYLAVGEVRTIVAELRDWRRRRRKREVAA